jgi:polysaccharide chain length determinant protein (PEP-CTERM system associated)
MPIVESSPARSAGQELRRLVEAPLRRPRHVLVPFVLVLGAGIALSFVLPKRYVSSTLILVAPDKLPESFVPTMATERIAKRLQTMRQEILSRTRLERVARELDPYKSLDREPIVQTIERMRDAIKVNVKGADAFSIEFEHPDPQVAMLVTDRLTSLFMEEVVGARERQVADAYDFIESQLAESRKELEGKDAELRKYKEKHMGTLPEQMVSNLSTLQRLQLEQQSLAESLRKAIDQQIVLEGSARSAAAAAAAAGTAGTAAPTDLPALRSQLAQLRLRYTDEHPDVQALVARIAELQQARPGSTGSGLEAGDDEPRTRVDQARREVALLREQQADLERRMAQFSARVETAPRTEQEIQSLTRDYQKLSENYSALLAKKLDAQMASRLERRSKGEQFRIVDPAFLPVKPSFPDHFTFALGGGLLGLLIGLALAVSADFLDPSVRDVRALESALPFPVVGVIPHIGRRQIRRILKAGVN